VPSPYHPDKQRFLKGGFLSFSLEHIHMIIPYSLQAVGRPQYQLARVIISKTTTSFFFLSLSLSLKFCLLMLCLLAVAPHPSLQYCNSAQKQPFSSVGCVGRSTFFLYETAAGRSCRAYVDMYFNYHVFFGYKYRPT
jgi:hypothetical protein